MPREFQVLCLAPGLVVAGAHARTRRACLFVCVRGSMKTMGNSCYPSPFPPFFRARAYACVPRPSASRCKAVALGDDNVVLVESVFVAFFVLAHPSCENAQ